MCIRDRFYTLPKTKRSIPQIYTRSKNLDDRVAIWPVGGKDSFKKVIDNIMYLNNNFPDNCIDNIFIVSDRDEDDVKETLDRIRQYFIQNYCKLECLNNNKVNKSFFNVDDEEYEFNIIPIIIPFEESGSLETLLLNQISCRSEEDKIVVNKAKEYVNDIIPVSYTHLLDSETEELEIIDAEGNFIYPGFIDAHTCLLYTSIGNRLPIAFLSLFTVIASN